MNFANGKIQSIRYTGHFPLTADGFQPAFGSATENVPDNLTCVYNCDHSIYYFELPDNQAFVMERTPSHIGEVQDRMIEAHRFHLGTKDHILATYGWQVNKLIGKPLEKSLPLRFVFTKETLPQFSSLTCLSGNCEASAAPQQVHIRLGKEGNYPYYEYKGMMQNKMLEGEGVFTQFNSDDKLEIRGRFQKGVLIGDFTFIGKASKANSMELHGTAVAGNITSMAGKLMYHGLPYGLAWSCANNAMYKIKEEDRGKLPGEMTLTRYWGEDGVKGTGYTLWTTGFLRPFCFHTFDSCNGYPLYGEITTAKGKDQFGKYFSEGEIRYENGTYDKQYIRGSYLTTSGCWEK